MTNINPKYPKFAQRERIEGTVVIEALISKYGTVKKTTIIKGHKALNEAAVSAIKSTSFEPAKMGSEPIESILKRQIVFKLD